MKISTILDHIDSGHMALPEFQRGYVWNRDQVRGLMSSLYQGHPVGSLLVWATESDTAQHRGDGSLAPGVVKLLLDGQQRITSLYGIVRGAAPEFFDGNEAVFTGLHFHLGREEFAFYSPIKMKGDPLWLDVSELMKAGHGGVGAQVAKLQSDAEHNATLGDYFGRLSKILRIKDLDLHIEEVTGSDKTIDVVVDIFNRVNSGGTKLSKGDLALAKICASSPEARDTLKTALGRWSEAGYKFSLDWLLRVVNTVATGEAKFNALHELEPEAFASGLKRAEKSIDTLLNLVAGRLGLDHDRVFFGRYAMPVAAHYLDRRGGHIADQVERDRLLFWYLQCAMWGRFSGSTESTIDKDLKLLEDMDGGLDRLLEELRLWRGQLAVEPEHFGGWSLGARFYPVLYLLTRVGKAMDWGTGIPLTASMLGKMAKLEVHHMFPKARLYKAGYKRAEVNAVANFCFLTKDTNLQISDKDPEIYFAEIEDKYPGALASQWIPMDRELWKVANYPAFLEARKVLLADAMNKFLGELLHGDMAALQRSATKSEVESPSVPGGIDTEEEDVALLEVNEWVVEQGLPAGSYLHELADVSTGEPLAVLDLAWPAGLQQGLSGPVALLLNEGPETIAAASRAGFRCFTSVSDFKVHTEHDALARHDGPAPAE